MNCFGRLLWDTDVTSIICSACHGNSFSPPHYANNPRMFQLTNWKKVSLNGVIIDEEYLSTKAENTQS